MGKPPEYDSPWKDQQPDNPGEAILAADAFKLLVTHFNSATFGGGEPSVDQKLVDTKRMHNALDRYRTLSFHSELDGIIGEDREDAIKKGMIEDGAIDGANPAEADEEFRIVAEGYERNKLYWDGILDRRIRFDL